jgi:hypothetical protein
MAGSRLWSALSGTLFALTWVSRATADDFTTGIRPLLAEYCLTCHSTAKQKGELDLEVFSSLDAVKKHPAVWQKVLEQLADGEMPPKNKPQLSAEQKGRLTGWVRGTLDQIATERAGDPGRVVIRRLSNAEYTYTLRDLTGVASLAPAREFPVDGAAGEGFTNTGQALVMSPALVTKYLDAGKDVAGHLVPLPVGVRFSEKTTRRDWTNETLAEIRALYGKYAGAGGGEKVVLQGVPLELSDGGRIPLEKYFDAAIEVKAGKSADAVARERQLSPRYLTTLLALLNDGQPSPLLDGLRATWRGAKPGDAKSLVSEIVPWQRALWKFGSVGHIGKLNGPKAWMEPVTPIVAQQELKAKLTAPADGSNDIVLYLAAGDAGDGNAGDLAVFQQPRLLIPGRPPLLLKDVPAFVADVAERRQHVFASTAKALAAAAEATAAQGALDSAALARKYDVDPDALAAWFDYLGIGSADAIKLDLFTKRLDQASTYAFVKGWGSKETPQILANSSDQHVRIPGNMKPHGVVVHPSPKLKAAVGWQSPIDGTVRVEGIVQHAHPECGNGVAWTVELRRGRTRQKLAAGVAQGAKAAPFGPLDKVAVQKGDLISILIDPREGNHSCDLTDLELKLTSVDDAKQAWSLTADVSPDVMAGNPHADRLGNAGVWHFYTEAIAGTAAEKGSVIPDNSLLAKWQSAATPADKAKLAAAIQALLTSPAPADKDGADAKLYRQLNSLSGPLFARVATKLPTKSEPTPTPAGSGSSLPFGKHPKGAALAATDLCIQAPASLTIRLPADLFAGSEFVTLATLDKAAVADGSVQVQLVTTKPDVKPGLVAGELVTGKAVGAWTDGSKPISNTTPVIAAEGGAARKRIEAAFDDFRRVFPAALCYTKIVPVDEVVTLTLYHREDDYLANLMLDDAERAKLDRLWAELRFVSQDALQLVDAFEQLWQYATQDADPKVFGPMKKPIYDRAAAFRQALLDAEPKHVDAVVALAERAYRRPMTNAERTDLKRLYAKLRQQELKHDDAIRLLLARVLVSPAFLYKAEQPAPGVAQAPVNDFELANRLSYFLWSSMPDQELISLAAAGKLRNPDVLSAQARRMSADPRVRRLATEFACQWLHVHDFAALDEKSERHFPTFGGLRAAMYEESILFFADFFASNGSVLGILDSDHAFLNEPLAKHYGIPGVKGAEFRRVDGVKKFGRGGILAQATTLSKQSGASRTSPILRGNWVAEALLGDKLPKPPKDVPQLPEDEGAVTLTMRQLTEKHTADPRCYGCHARIDAFGFTLESFDAIGRLRDKDLGNRPIDVRAKVIDGTEITGLEGLRHYLTTNRRDAFVRQFTRKLLGYALGRAVQLSDEPLLREIQTKLAADGYHVGVAIDAIVRSKPFREIRGKDAAFDE